MATKNIEDANVRGASVKLGAQYKTTITKDLNLHMGASFKLSNNLKSTGTENLYSLSIGASGFEQPRDTIFSGPLKANLERPTETIFGIGLGKTNKWYAAVNYKMQDALIATGYFDNSAQSFQYGESNRISAGGYFIPKINSITSNWQRVTYRGGVKFEKLGLLVNGTPGSNTFTSIDDFGISFGLGLPIGPQSRLFSEVHLGFEYGQRGTKNQNLIQENFFNFNVSLSVTDRWFQKRKYN